MFSKFSLLCLIVCLGLFFYGCEQSIMNGTDSNTLDAASEFNAGNGQTVNPLADEDDDDGGSVQLDIFNVSYTPRIVGEFSGQDFYTTTSSQTEYNIINIDEAGDPDLGHFWSVEYNETGNYNTDLFTYEWRMIKGLHLPSSPIIQQVNGESVVLSTTAYHDTFPLRYRVTLTVFYDGAWMNTFAAEYSISDPDN